jgi:hypothetical protein
MTGFSYIASPYTHPDHAVRRGRWRAAVRFLQWCLARQDWVYSPIAHCEEAARLAALPTNFQFWQSFNHTMLGAARGLYVLRLPDWEQSAGVADEIAFAAGRGLPVQHFLPVEDDYQAVAGGAGGPTP